LLEKEYYITIYLIIGKMSAQDKTNCEHQIG